MLGTPGEANQRVRNRTRSRLLSVGSGVVEKPLPPSASYFAKHLALTRKLTGHHGCVNTLSWSDNGEWLLSGSDDRHLHIWQGDVGALVSSLATGHTANIFSAKFLPESNHQKIVSCAANGIVRYMETAHAPTFPCAEPVTAPVSRNAYLRSATQSARPAFKCHTDLTYKVLTDPLSPATFFSCGDDAKINMYDVRVADSCMCEGCTRFRVVDMKAVAQAEGKLRRRIWKKSNQDPQGAVGNAEDDIGSKRKRKASTTTPVMTEQPARRATQLPLWFRGAARSPGGNYGVMGLSINPNQPFHLATSCNDDTVRIFDRRNLAKPVYAFVPSHFAAYEKAYRVCSTVSQQHDPPSYEASALTTPLPPPPKRRDARRFMDYKITDIHYDPASSGGPGSGDLLISYSRERVMLVDTSSLNAMPESDLSMSKWPWPRGHEDVVRVYRGHRNERTMIKEANFYGANSEIIVSGSDDGRVYMWDRYTGDLVNVFLGDKKVVNAVQPHPHLPYLAVSGIDNDIRFFTPIGKKPAELGSVGLEARILDNERGLGYSDDRWSGGQVAYDGPGVTTGQVHEWMHRLRHRQELWASTGGANSVKDSESEEQDQHHWSNEDYDDDDDDQEEDNEDDNEDDDDSDDAGEVDRPAMVLQLLELLTGSGTIMFDAPSDDHDSSDGPDDDEAAESGDLPAEHQQG
ncbi:DDB1- and CUL4-associated factor 6 [Sorochytrium milnesiophthora]